MSRDFQKDSLSDFESDTDLGIDDDAMGEYLDDEKPRKPKNGKQLKKFKHPSDR